MASTGSCSTECDFTQRQHLIQLSAPDRTTTVTIQALYWGVACTSWHFMTVNSIGSEYPSHYGHFDREIALKGSNSLDSYYITDNVIEIPCLAAPGNNSAYTFCYNTQHAMHTPELNVGFTTSVCNNVRGWYGPILLFATDPKNHVRRMQPKDASIATDTIRK